VIANNFMPFLFVDYEQGAGGERFCAGLSNSPQCETLDFVRYDNGRTKVKDLFEQEFLKTQPNITAVKSHPALYTIVPTHRHTDLAKQLLEDVNTIRIQSPVDDAIFQSVKQQ
jgi:hypothetical protein